VPTSCLRNCLIGRNSSHTDTQKHRPRYASVAIGRIQESVPLVETVRPVRMSTLSHTQTQTHIHTHHATSLSVETVRPVRMSTWSHTNTDTHTQRPRYLSVGRNSSSCTYVHIVPHTNTDTHTQRPRYLSVGRNSSSCTYVHIVQLVSLTWSQNACRGSDIFSLVSKPPCEQRRLAPAGEYDCTTRVRRRYGLISHHYNHLRNIASIGLCPIHTATPDATQDSPVCVVSGVAV